jgi:hypothetical protein
MKQYEFNFNSNPKLPKCGEENIYTNQYVKVVFMNNYNLYYIDDNPDTNTSLIDIKQNITLFLISTSNSAHSISEIIDFINYYKKNINSNNLIGISEYVISSLPLLYELIKIFIPENKIKILYNKYTYKIDTLITYRNHHFNYLNNWNEIPFSKENNILYFNNLENVKSGFVSDSIFFFNKIKEIYNEHKNKYKLYDNIMLIKTNEDKYVFSRNRCMDKINDNIKKLLIDKNIAILSINDFKNIYEYICVFYHAKNVIVSYGGIACTNRFFCNQDANIILIANLHYQHEYEYENSNQLYWHIRHSHIYSAKKQTVLLDFENNININNINLILNLLE